MNSVCVWRLLVAGYIVHVFVPFSQNYPYQKQHEHKCKCTKDIEPVVEEHHHLSYLSVMENLYIF